MSKKQKLIEKLKRRSKNFDYNEAEHLLVLLGFRKSNKGKTSGSRVIFKCGNAHIRLHKPHPQKELSLYQIDELLETLEREGLI